MDRADDEVQLHPVQRRHGTAGAGGVGGHADLSALQHRQLGELSPELGQTGAPGGKIGQVDVGWRIEVHVVGNAYLAQAVFRGGGQHLGGVIVRVEGIGAVCMQIRCNKHFAEPPLMS